ncbi:MAG: ATP-binding protein [Myxococcota bacterium]
MTDLDWKRRAEAAERTVSVLKDRVRALLNGSQGLLDKQLERSRAREEQNRQKRALMEMRTAELEKHNQRLEAVVAERTKALRDILDNVRSGFLVIGPDLRVRTGYTKSCAEFFGHIEAGQSFSSLVGCPSGNPSLELALEQVFEDLLPEALSLDQVPRRFLPENERTIEAVPSVIRGAQGEVHSLLFSVSDVTALEAAQRETQENEALVNILRSGSTFSDFLADCREDLNSARAAAAVLDAQVIARRLVHTLKGNSASFGLVSIYQTIHAVEEQAVIDAHALDRIEDAFRGYLNRNAAVLGISWDQAPAEQVVVSTRRLDDLRARVEARDLPAARAWVEEVQERTAASLLGPMDRLVEGLTVRLQKPVRWELVGGEVLVDPVQLRPVFRNLSHLVRNAIDHGIEPAGQRGDKPAEATLRLSIVRHHDGWTLRMHDDGRGVDVPTLVDRALEKGLISQSMAASMDREGQLALVFLDGLSAAESTTEISGRGVGMSAVRQAVELVGGEIHLLSEPGQGTEVAIHIPTRPKLRHSLQPASSRPRLAG